MKDQYVIYAQYSHDAEFFGTLAECKEWFAVAGLTVGKSFFIARKGE